MAQLRLFKDKLSKSQQDNINQFVCVLQAHVTKLKENCASQEVIELAQAALVRAKSCQED